MAPKSILSFLTLSLLCVLVLGCDTNSSQEEFVALERADFSDAQYGITVIDSEDNVVLLGTLFLSLEEDQISGSWNIETWGERPEFSSLAVNEGGHFPSADFLSTLTGTLFGETALIQIELPGSDTFLAMSIEGRQEDRLVGRASLLPDQRFDGRFEAIRQ